MLEEIKNFVMNYELTLLTWGIYTVIYALLLASQGRKRVKRMFVKKIRTEAEVIGLDIVKKIRWSVFKIMFIGFIALSTATLISMSLK